MIKSIVATKEKLQCVFHIWIPGIEALIDKLLMVITLYWTVFVSGAMISSSVNSTWALPSLAAGEAFESFSEPLSDFPSLSTAEGCWTDFCFCCSFLFCEIFIKITKSPTEAIENVLVKVFFKKNCYKPFFQHWIFWWYSSFCWFHKVYRWVVFQLVLLQMFCHRVTDG